MTETKWPTHPWQRDCLVVAVQSIELGGERVPFSFELMTVEDRQITTLSSLAVAWARRGRPGRPTDDELRQALATARALRPLSPEDLARGETPLSAFQLAGKVLRTAARHDSLLVTHDPDGLRALLRSVEGWLDVDLPPLSVVHTAVLERARHRRLRQHPGESDGDFYARLEAADGELPNLCRSYAELEWPDGGLRTTDRGFAALATHALYQSHFHGRLLGAAAGAGDIG